MPNEGHNTILDVLTTFAMKVGVLLGVPPCSLVASITSISDEGFVLICRVEDFPWTIEPLLHSENFVLFSRAACRNMSCDNKGKP